MNGRHDHTTLQFASLYNGQGVFVWSDCLLDLGADFLVGYMQTMKEMGLIFLPVELDRP